MYEHRQALCCGGSWPASVAIRKDPFDLLRAARTVRDSHAQLQFQKCEDDLARNRQRRSGRSQADGCDSSDAASNNSDSKGAAKKPFALSDVSMAMICDCWLEQDHLGGLLLAESGPKRLTKVGQERSPSVYKIGAIQVNSSQSLPLTRPQQKLLPAGKQYSGESRFGRYRLAQVSSEGAAAHWVSQPVRHQKIFL